MLTIVTLSQKPSRPVPTGVQLGVIGILVTQLMEIVIAAYLWSVAKRSLSAELFGKVQRNSWDKLIQYLIYAFIA